MPRLTHRKPSYRKHKASGLAVATIGGADIETSENTGPPKAKRLIGN